MFLYLGKCINCQKIYAKLFEKSQDIAAVDSIQTPNCRRQLFEIHKWYCFFLLIAYYQYNLFPLPFGVVY